MDIPLPYTTKCLDPQRIVNPYTNELLTVPCGRCRACQLNKNNRYSFQCQLESYIHKYTLFITLTYDNKHIPRAQFVDNITRPFGCDVYDKDTGEFLGECDMLQEDRQKLLDKFNILGDIPYLRKHDLQSFFKRFRYYAGKFTQSKVRYYAVGEMGPVHYRPHFHILLFFDDPTLLQVSEDCVRQSWSFGRIDVQLSKGKVSTYVTSYVNSTCDLPRLYQLPALRPFCLHSQRLGQGFFKNQRERVYETSARDFISKSIVINEKYREFRVWRSCYSYFFPKVKGYFDKSTSELCYSYGIYREARYFLGYDNLPLSYIAVDIYTLLGADLPRAVSVHDRRFQKFIEYFRESDFNYRTLDCDCIDRCINRIYIQLLVSRHFLDFCCDHEFGKFPVHEEILFKVRKIQEFYKQLEYIRLTDFFESQRLYYESDFSGEDEEMINRLGERFIPQFYDNAPLTGYKEMRSYFAYCQEVWRQSHDRVKHKILNDKNRVFNEM